MKQLFRRIFTCLLALSLAAGSAFALDGAEAARRFRQAARAINREGLIAETEPITDEEIVAACALLEKSPDRIYELVNGFLSRMDSHSMYLAPQSYSSSYSTLTGYAGIGVVVRYTAGGFLVEEVTPHAPAAQAGVQVGDRLRAVDGKAVDGLALDDLTALLRGEAGSTVTLTVEREGKELSFDLTRAVVRQPEVASRELAAGVYYIAIDGFTSEYTPGDFADALDALGEGDDLILDLRDNGGGVVDYALTVADLLLEERIVMCTMRVRDDQGGGVAYTSAGGGPDLDDLIVLVNEDTASAAELLAGILHEAGGATLLGETTYGKGQGQYHMEMPCGDRLVITALAMELPQSGCWEGVGLTPDVEVALQKMSDALAGCAPLDTETPIAYGERSENVRAMTERLVLLGYLGEATDVFTTPVLSALRAFQEDAGLSTTIGAYPETLSMLSENVARAAAQSYYTDSQLTAALARAA